MQVKKRGNRGYEPVKFDKITARIANMCRGLDNVDPTLIALHTIKNIVNNISTEELDRISAEVAESHKLTHPNYSTVAAKILISNLQKSTPSSFARATQEYSTITGNQSGDYEFIAKNGDELDNMIIHDNDFNFSYLGFKTADYTYLRKVHEPVYDENGSLIFIAEDETEVSGPAVDDYNGALKPKLKTRTIDRMQYVYMRTAVAIYRHLPLRQAMEKIKMYYKLMSNGYITHATPTLANACEPQQQLASCFLFGTHDSIEGINKTLTNCAYSSKKGGGLGIHMSNIRCAGQYIHGTRGFSNGLKPQLKNYNENAKCWNQGGRRPGAYAIYLEPWHGDILTFLRMKLPHGNDTERARDLFYGLWMPDLFVKRLINNEKWSLFSEDTAPGLSDVYDGMLVCKKCNYCHNSAYNKYIINVANATNIACNHEFEPVDAFTELYTRYEKSHKSVRSMPAIDIAREIFTSQRETGTPYMCFKDHVNRMSNQMGIGTVKSSNLCTEICEVSSDTSYATCTLASISLKKFLVRDNNDKKLVFDHELLHKTVELVAESLDIVIDINNYPVEECVKNARDYRPIGIGVQGLANVFNILRIPFLSEAAAKLDLEIFETIYHAAMTASINGAKKHGSFVGFHQSPAASGQLAPHLWIKNQSRLGNNIDITSLYSGRYDWDELCDDVKLHGLRNSLHISPMPTVSTSQLLGNNESFEPFDSNIFAKKTQSGKHTVINEHMVQHLIELKLWNENLKNKIVVNRGSTIGIDEIPKDVQEIYRTCWEMKQIEIMKRASKRQAFVDQSQSLNLHLQNNSDETLMSVLVNGWKLGLKTGNYYIRTRPAIDPMNNNVAQLRLQNMVAPEKSPRQIISEPVIECNMEEGCTFCSS